MDALIPEVAQMGIAGLFFVMWWLERRDKTTSEKQVAKMTDVAGRACSLAEEAHEDRREMIQALQNNTEAMTVLTERIRALDTQQGG